MPDIRALRPEELEPAAALVNVCWRAAYPGILDQDFLDGLTTPDRMERIQRRLDEGSRAWAAVDGDALVGIAVAGASTIPEYPGDGELQMLYVRPDRIGTGLGRALLERACDELARAGHAYLILDVFAGNDRAIRFYRAHGFETIRAANPALSVPGGHLYPLEYMRRAAPRRQPDDRAGVSVRPAGDDDADAVVGFALALTDFNRAHHPDRYTRDEYAPVRAACQATARRKFLARDGSALYLIAEADGTPVGYAVARVETAAPESDNGTGEVGLLDELFVTEEARGRGVGGRLLEECLAWLWRRGVGRVRLYAYAWNAPARALYERRGFGVSSLRYDLFPDESPGRSPMEDHGHHDD